MDMTMILLDFLRLLSSLANPVITLVFSIALDFLQKRGQKLLVHVVGVVMLDLSLPTSSPAIQVHALALVPLSRPVDTKTA